MDIKATIHEWHKRRNQAPDNELFRIDSEYAAWMGMPTLGALMALMNDLERAKGLISPQEAQHALNQAIQFAIGEANKRLAAATNDSSLSIPGIGFTGIVLLEELIANDPNAVLR